MILACGCDTIWTDYFDRCAPCRERLSTEADILIKREKESSPRGSDWSKSGDAYYIRGTGGYDVLESGPAFTLERK